MGEWRVEKHPDDGFGWRIVRSWPPIDATEVFACGLTEENANRLLPVLNGGLTERSCHHGWLGAAAERIETPCPACGGQSLFIGSGGHLICARVPGRSGDGCPNPSVESEINDLQSAIEDGLLTLVAIASQPATAGRLWADNHTLGATLARLRKALRQADPPDPIAKRFQA